MPTNLSKFKRFQKNPELESFRKLNAIEKGTKAEISEMEERIVERISSNPNILAKIMQSVGRLMKGDTGEQGEKGDRGENGEIGDEGYTPQAGVDFFTEDDIMDVVARVQNSIYIPKDGKDGTDGVTPVAGIDYPNDEQLREMCELNVGRLFMEKKTLFEKDIAEATKKLQEQIDFNAKAAEIARGLETLKGKEKLDYNALKNLPSIPTAGKGGKMYVRGADGNVVGPSSSTDSYIPQWDGTTGKLLTDGLPTTTWLNIDQTTPQEIINGIPLMDVDADEFDDESQVVNKRYVNSTINQIGATFYMLDAADGTVATYKQTAMTASALATATVDSPTISSSTDTLIEEWISPSTMTFSSLSAGPYDLNIYAARTSGNRTCRLFWRFYERLADNSEVLIATSGLSNVFTTKAHMRVYAAIDDYTPSIGSRLVGKVYAQTTTIGGSGSDTVVTLYYQGDEDSHWDIPVDRAYLSETYVAKAGDTMTGALVGADSDGTTAQMVNVVYGTAESVDMTSMPVGTIYFRHEA